MFVSYSKLTGFIDIPSLSLANLYGRTVRLMDHGPIFNLRATSTSG